MSVGLLAKFVINLILIPAYGKEGAAISLAIAAVVMVIVSVKLLLKHHYELPNLLFTTGKILLATLTGMVCVYFLSFDFYIGLAMFVGIYIFCVLTLQVFDNFEVEIMRNLMSKLKFRQSKR